MYARQLSDILGRSLAEPGSWEQTAERFERLRGYNLLPRGRQNAAVRLSDKQIASAVLSFAPTAPSWAGHVSLILGDLRPVGGRDVSFGQAATLVDTIAMVLSSDESCSSVVSISLSIVREQNEDEYYAKAVFETDGVRRTISYVSKMALSLQSPGAELSYDHDHITGPTARQLVLAPSFFKRLRRDIVISRRLDFPPKTDWREYETEEEREAFHRKLGARAGSRFLNIAVEAGVTWPSEPKRVEFAGHHFVLFPRTKESSQSISIDLTHERLSSVEARTLLNRFLSLLSWCDDSYAVLKDGWSGNPIPVPAPRSDGGGFSTAPHWIFSRSIPDGPELLQRLAYYREGLNARRAGLVTFEVLSFFKVFENRSRTKPGVESATKRWIREAFPEVAASLRAEVLQSLDAHRNGKSVEAYVMENCRVATAHASDAFPSDADASPEIGRLYSAAELIHALARHYIRTEYRLSDLYYSDEV